MPHSRQNPIALRIPLHKPEDGGWGGAVFEPARCEVEAMSIAQS
jgi:hypothetical protein